MLLETKSRAVAILLYILVTFLILLGIGNGLFMLAAPEVWYYAVPGVVRTGLFNQHFIRDIAIIYLFIGIAFSVGLFRPAMRVELWAAASLWLAAHAIFHFWEVAVGLCSPSVLPTDFPAVTLPALIGLSITTWAWLSKPQATRASISPHPAGVHR